MASIIGDRNKLTLNLDKSNLCYYAYFGSLREYVRVGLEDIIMNWPASLFVDQYYDGVNTATTVDNYSHNWITDLASFEVSTEVLTNNNKKLSFFMLIKVVSI